MGTFSAAKDSFKGPDAAVATIAVRFRRVNSESSLFVHLKVLIMGMFSFLMQYHKCWLYSDTKIIDFVIAQILYILLILEHVIFLVEALTRAQGRSG